MGVFGVFVFKTPVLGLDLECAYVYLDEKTKQPNKKTSRTRKESKMLARNSFLISFFSFLLVHGHLFCHFSAKLPVLIKKTSWNTLLEYNHRDDVKRPSHGKLKLANSSRCVWMARKQSANTLAKCWRQIELASILANYFTNFFLSVYSYLSCERLANMCWWLPTHQNELYSRDLFAWHFTKWRTWVNTF